MGTSEGSTQASTPVTRSAASAGLPERVPHRSWHQKWRRMRPFPGLIAAISEANRRLVMTRISDCSTHARELPNSSASNGKYCSAVSLRPTVDRAAVSMLAAIISAVEDVRSAGGPQAIGVVTEESDAVTLSDISARLGGRRTSESLRLLAAGQRGPGGFPPPLMDTGKLRVYSWAQVVTWLRDVLGEEIPEPTPDLALADQALRLAAWARATDRSGDIQQLICAG